MDPDTAFHALLNTLLIDVDMLNRFWTIFETAQTFYLVDDKGEHLSFSLNNKSIQVAFDKQAKSIACFFLCLPFRWLSFVCRFLSLFVSFEKRFHYHTSSDTTGSIAICNIRSAITPKAQLSLTRSLAHTCIFSNFKMHESIKCENKIYVLYMKCHCTARRVIVICVEGVL